MSERFRQLTYAVSGDGTLLDEINHISPEVRRILAELRPDIEKGRKYLFKKVNKLCLQYPRVPVFKNILSNLYQQHGNMEQAIAVNHWLVKEHPDYLFGKVNLAAEALIREEPEEIPEILGDYLEIGSLYPERKEFHVEEVLAFNFIAIQYFLALDKIEDAEMRLEIMEKLDEEHPKTLQSQNSMQQWYQNKAAIRSAVRKENQRTVPVKDNRSHLQTTEAPHFNYPEQIGWLYEDGLEINLLKVESILQLEPQKLIDDLEKMLQDSIARFDFFLELTEHNAVELHELDFPQHALLLLAHLNSEKSFEKILSVLQQDAEYNDFWFGYNFSYLVQTALFYCGKNKMPELFEFLKQPNIYGQNKAVVGETMVNMIKDRAASEAYIPKYEEVLDHYIINAEDENLADTEAISFLISDIVDLGLISLLPKIRQLFDLNLVDNFICGDFEELEPEMRKASFGILLPFITDNLEDQYAFLSAEEERHFVPNKFPDLEQLYYGKDIEALNEYEHEPLKSEKKIGRNDSCPCGSGKKYKKCCMNA